MTLNDLTARERETLLAVVDNPFGVGRPDAASWVWVVADTRARSAALAALVRKRFAWRSGVGEDEVCGLTPLGQAVYAQLTAAAIK